MEVDVKYKIGKQNYRTHTQKTRYRLQGKKKKEWCFKEKLGEDKRQLQQTLLDPGLRGALGEITPLISTQICILLKSWMIFTFMNNLHFLYSEFFRPKFHESWFIRAKIYL